MSLPANVLYAIVGLVVHVNHEYIHLLRSILPGVVLSIVEKLTLITEENNGVDEAESENKKTMG